MRYTTRLQLALFLFRSILAPNGRIIIVIITKYGCVRVCVLRVSSNTCFSVTKKVAFTVHKRINGGKQSQLKILFPNFQELDIRMTRYERGGKQSATLSGIDHKKRVLYFPSRHGS